MPRARDKRTDLTAAAVKNAPAGEHWDGMERGLHLRVSPLGKRVWFLRYRGAGGMQRRFKLGVYPNLGLAEARTAAREKKAEVAQGKDPAARRRLLFGDLATKALVIIEPDTRPRTIELRREMLDNDLLPRWRNKPAASIRRADVAELAREIAARGAPVTANRTVALVRLLYNAALDLELVDSNPATRPKRFLQPEAPRERDLTAEELKAICAAIQAQRPEPRAFAEVLLATAQRAGALAGARWAEFDLPGALWTIPAEPGRKFSGHPRLVPLNRLALDALERLQEVSDEGEEYLFPSRDKSKGPTWSNWQKLNARLRTSSGVEDWSLHTFRSAFRTTATRARDDEKRPGLGVAAEVADLVLGHTLETVGHIHYNADKARYLLPEKADALRRWAEYLEAVAREKGAEA